MHEREVPHYELRRIDSDGDVSEPEIVPVSEFPWDAHTNRRGFLGASIAATTLAAALNRANADPKDASSSRARKAICAHAKSILDLAFSPDGSHLVSASSDNTAKVWNLREGELAATLEGHRSSVFCVAVDPDNEAVATGSSDRTIRIWSLSDGEHRATFTGHKATVRTLAFTGSGKSLVSGSSDSSLRIWPLPDGERASVFDDHQGWVFDLLVTPDDRFIATASRDKAIRIWSNPDGRLLKTLEGHRAEVTEIVATPDNTKLISRSSDDTLGIWALPSGSLLRKLSGPWSRVSHLDISPEGDVLATAYHDTIRLWTIPDGKPIAELVGHEAIISCLRFSPAGNHLASSDRDGVIILWNRGTNKIDSYVFDPEANEAGRDGVKVNVFDSVTQSYVTYTLPCGAPIPPNATCICNCIPGTISLPVPEVRVPEPPVYIPRNWPTTPYAPPRYYPRNGRRSGGGTYCSCNQVCVCIPVCQAHRLLHSDPVVRSMAEHLLLTMGRRQANYLAWAASQASGSLRKRIEQITSKIMMGSKPDLRRSPSDVDCLARLDHSDDVVAIMAAQVLRCRNSFYPRRFSAADEQHIDRLVNARRRRMGTRKARKYSCRHHSGVRCDCTGNRYLSRHQPQGRAWRSDQGCYVNGRSCR